MYNKSQRNFNKIKTIIFNICFFIILILLLLFFYMYDKIPTNDLKNKCYEYLTSKDEDVVEYKNMIMLMYPKEVYVIKKVNKNIEYNIIEEEECFELINQGSILEQKNRYFKVKIKVTSYNYAEAYKNAVMATNKYIEQNKNISKEEIEKYFATRLEYEGGKIIDNKEKTVMYVYKKQDDVDIGRGDYSVVISKLPEQKDNLDFLNAMLGGLVEEMDRTKLPEGVDLEETLQLMEIE